MVDVPTTKVLAIGRITAKGTLEARVPIMLPEVRSTVRLHLAGKLDQWCCQTEGSGVVFIMNVTSTAEAHELLEPLPLRQADMTEFQLSPLGPLKPPGLLLTGGKLSEDIDFNRTWTLEQYGHGRK